MKKCPHCQGNQFKAVIKRPGVIRMNEDGTVTIVKEIEKFATEVVECLKCKEKVSNDQLTDDMPCSQCGNPTKPETMVDGLCPVCNAIKSRPDLSGASQTDLIKRLLELESQLNAKAGDKVVAKVEEANQTVENVQVKAEQAEAKAEQEKAAAAAITPEQQAEIKKRSEAAQKAAETRKANAEKRRLEEAAAANEQTPQTDAPTEQPTQAPEQTPTHVEPPLETGAPDFDLPMGSDESLGIVPPAMDMEDPF